MGAERKLLDLKDFGTEVDEQAIVQFGGFQIVEHLRFVVRVERIGGLELHNDTLINQKVGREVADEETILVKDLNTLLLFNPEPKARQAVCKGVFVNTFQEPDTEITVDIIGSLTDDVTELIRCHNSLPFNGSVSRLCVSSLCALCVLCGC